MTPSDQFQAIVIGSGQGGNPLCIALAQAGFRTALIERQFVGGTCINYGCSPTKTMVASARVAYLARRGVDYGVRTGDVRVDMARVRERKRGVVENFRNSRLGSFKNLPNFELIFGDAAFTGPNTLHVRLRDGGVRELSGEKIFIDAGTRPAVPAIDGLKDAPFLDSTSIMELDTLPEHLIVLGGGYVGLEFGQMFRRFGSRVTIVQAGPQLLKGEDVDVAGAVAQILQQDGVTVLLNAKATSVTKSGGQIHVTVRVGEESHVVDGSDLLVATGRTPNTETLNLAAAGVATNKRGFIPVNAKLETNVPGIYAMGDINGGPAFTHISYDDFRILRANVIEKGNASTEGRLVPYALYIDPQLGRIGLTEEQARAQNKKVRVARMPMTSVARATETSETRGFMKALVDADSGQILGAAVLGAEGAEIMSMLELAMMGKLTHAVLHDAIFAHPTFAESLNNLFLHFDS
jgi:pyruvate/2-oxoglutarate dehydrogenase complex dihydrolipoamide dehydrogenase (E3) component